MTMSAEQKLLCTLISCYLDVVSEERVTAEVGRGVDWMRLLAAAKTERLGGFLYAVLKQKDILPKVPAHAAQELEKIYLTYKARNLLLFDELSMMAAIFEKEQIPAIVIKGGNLVRLCYPDKGMRGMDDIDIVVRQGAFENAREVLLSKGYTRSPYDRDIMFAPSGGMVDLHRDAFDQHRIRTRRFYCHWDFHRIWTDAVPYSAECRQVRFLKPLDELIVSAIHTAKHSFAGLNHFLDAALLIRALIETSPLEGQGTARRIAAEQFFERAEFFGGKRALYFVLYFLDKELGLKLPELDYEKLLDNPLSGYERRALQAVLGRKQTELMGTVLPVFVIRGWLRKIIYIAENIFPRPAVMREIYQTNNMLKIWCMYPVRLVEAICTLLISFPRA